MKKFLSILASGMATFGAVTWASAQSGSDQPQTWYFYQAGWGLGGIISGSFTGVDSNGDGQLASFSGEVSDFDVSMNGSSLIPDGYTWNQAALWGIVYDINGGPFLGDGRTGKVEGFGVHDELYNYYSGYGPNGTPGGTIYDSSETPLDSTPDPIMVSTSPITPEIYASQLGSYDFPTGTLTPEPAVYLLSGLGGLVWVLTRKRKA